MAATAYLLGRKRAILAAPFSGTDRLYAAERLDGTEMRDGAYTHCTFANISFKESKLINLRFQNCTFVGCYFRRTDLTDCDFSGCRFISCDFPKVAVRSCSFRYASFDGCFIGFAEIQHSLPQEPNLREDLARNLGTAASSLGFYKEARAYSLCEIRAHEQDLKAAALGESQWYQEHYDSLRRIGAGFEFIFSVFARVVWGGGLKAYALVRTFLILTIVVFPAIFKMAPGQLSKAGASSVSSLGDLVFFSMENMIPAGVKSGVVATSNLTRGIAAAEALVGLVITGLFVSYLFVWVNER